MTAGRKIPTGATPFGFLPCGAGFYHLNEDGTPFADEGTPVVYYKVEDEYREQVASALGSGLSNARRYFYDRGERQEIYVHLGYWELVVPAEVVL